MPAGVAKADIPRFPTPSPVINKLTKGSDKRKMFERLYPEYVFLCSFAHGLPDALLFKMMFNKNARVPKQFDDETLKDTFLGTIPVSRTIQNLAFAGPDKKTLYLMGSGALYRIQMLAEGYKGRPK